MIAVGTRVRVEVPPGRIDSYLDGKTGVVCGPLASVNGADLVGVRFGDGSTFTEVWCDAATLRERHPDSTQTLLDEVSEALEALAQQDEHNARYAARDAVRALRARFDAWRLA